MSPRLHIVRVDIDPAHEDAFNAWYETVHVPALLACPGWLSARRYLSRDGGPKYAAVYEVAGDWVYETPEFLAVRGFQAFEPHVRNFARLVLDPLETCPIALQSRTPPAPCLDARSCAEPAPTSAESALSAEVTAASR